MSNWTDMLNSLLPTNNSRQITATTLRNILGHADNPIGITTDSGGGGGLGLDLVEIGMLESEHIVVFTGTGAKSLSIPTTWPDRLPLTIVNASNSGNVTFILPGGAYGGFASNDIFEVTVNSGGISLTSGWQKTYRGSLRVMKLNSKWLLLV